MFSLRLIGLYGYIIALAIYAWKDWFLALCGLILLTVLLEHPEMPHTVMGIQGLNPWNIVLAVIVVAWLTTRRLDGSHWDMPGFVTALFGLYLVLTGITYVRGAMDLGSLPEEYRETFFSFTSDEIINPLKLIVPGLMLFDGCRTRNRMLMAVCCVLLLGVGYALLVLKTMPFGELAGSSDFMLFRYRINRDTGLHANDMAMLLVGAFWSLVAAYALYRTKLWRFGMAGAAAIVFLAMALCFSRAGYVSFVAVGLLFGLFVWRPLLAILPIVGLLVCVAIPSIPARLGMGIGTGTAVSQDASDLNEITSGRMTTIWPPVIEYISDSPLLGYGRRATVRTGVYDILSAEGEPVGHPHNAYLEVLIDAGLVGLAIMLAFYGTLSIMAVRLLRYRGDPLCVAVGGMAMATITALLVSGLSSQSLFPTVSMFAMWCAIGLLVRAYVSVRQSAAAAVYTEEYVEPYSPRHDAVTSGSTY
jgi:oligosaccharide repeat unit polymerase